MNLYHTYNAETFVYETSNYFKNRPENGTAIHPTDNFLIRKWDEENQEWYEGATDEEIAASIEVPNQVTAIQFISQLEFEGITEEQIMNKINTLQEPNKTIAKVSYQRAVYFERNHPFIDMVGLVFGKSKNDLDNIFINASKL